MLFNSYIFILCFLPITLIIYYILNHKGKNEAGKVWLLGMSLWFYGYFNIGYMLLLCVSIILNYLCIRLMLKQQSQGKKKMLLCAGVILDIGILFYYKYFDFLFENINAIFGTKFPLLGLLLPIGISFYTFRQISLVIDCYRGQVPQYTFIDYAAYVTFFPQLTAGPIVLHSELVPQLCDVNKKHVDYSNLSKGLYGFALGLAKKVLIADNLSKIVTAGYGDIASLDSTNALIVMLCYTLQIYFDFSGYSDMALGIGCMFNITTPMNFNSPYKATSIVEFWDRWHMTLTRFFTQYVYIPLGGNRKGKARTYLNTLIVFCISGLWHGANWTFILWGSIYGVLLVINKIFAKPLEKIPRLIRWIVTFAIVNILWVYFRADSITSANLMLQQLFTAGFGGVSTVLTETFGELIEVKVLYHLGLDGLLRSCPYIPLLVFIAVILVATVFMRNTQEKMKAFVPNVHKLLVTFVLLVWCTLSLSGVSEFLYFNF